MLDAKVFKDYEIRNTIASESGKGVNKRIDVSICVVEKLVEYIVYSNKKMVLETECLDSAIEVFNKITCKTEGNE